jgi:hypothetical protein
MLKQERRNHMKTNQILSSERGIGLLYSEECPYRNFAGDICTASVSHMIISTRTVSKYCVTEDHDLCPMFLSKMLRSG